MTDFPELQQALVGAAQRRYSPRRRAWRVLRVAVPAAAVVALLVVLAAGERASDERPATPSPTPAPTLAPIDPLSRNYEVFRRPSASTDRLPGEPVTPPDEPGTAIENRPRRLFEGIYAVAAVHTIRGEKRPSVCLLQFAGDVQERGRCVDVNENPALGGTVLYLPVVVDGSPAIAALAADDISELEVEYSDGTSERHPFVGSAVLVPGDPWPSDLEWRNTAGGVVGVDLSTERPGG